MKVKLLINENRITEVRTKLQELGIEIDDDAEFVLMEKNKFISHMPVRDNKGERCNVPVEDIIYIESYSHNVDIHTVDSCYKSTEALYQIIGMLNPEEFLRISNSVIISRRHVKKIKPALSMKFVLTMTDGTLVDVTRSYYNIFKEFFNI